MHIVLKLGLSLMLLGGCINVVGKVFAPHPSGIIPGTTEDIGVAVGVLGFIILMFYVAVAIWS